MYSGHGFFSKFSKTGFILNISMPYILTTHLLMNKFPSFPIKVGPQGTITPKNPDRAAHNTFYGYLMPANGELLGFCVDFVAFGRDGVFQVFNYDPTANQAQFLQKISSNDDDFEPFGSGNTHLDEKIAIKAGTYLFAVQRITGVPAPANGPAHITAYVRFT